MARILVAEDDSGANRLICAMLSRAGYEPIAAYDGLDALAKLDQCQVDMLICDVMMPRMDGMRLVSELRSTGCRLPILMLTAKRGQESKNEGFIAGVDDYLTKPADMTELVLRVRALLRRAGVPDGSPLTVGAVTLDSSEFAVRRGEEEIALPPKEFQLLNKLLANPGRVFTRMQLLEDIWGWDSDSLESTVKVHVNRLRTRFSEWDDFSIQTVRGVGYKAEIAQDWEDVKE